MMRTTALLLLTLISLQDAEPGLVAEYFQLGAPPANFPNLAASTKPVLVRVDKNVDFGEVDGDFHGTRLSENFYARWTGILRVEKDGKHQFWTESDDGSKLTIDGKVVVDNGGNHPMS